MGLMIFLGWWDVIVITLALETLLMAVLLAIFGGTQKLQYAGMTLAVTPLRYGTLLFDAVTVSRFLLDVLKPGKKHWRK
jgi:hypothetical protein